MLYCHVFRLCLLTLMVSHFTIEPNVGMVTVPDSRLDELSKIINPKRVQHATVEFTDIAGLVKGAASGEGLGNKFLANIKNTQAICQVVRCFEDENVIHVDGSVDPIRDIEVINAELILADLESVERGIDKQAKLVRAKNKEAMALMPVLEKCKVQLEDSKLLNMLFMSTPKSSLSFGLILFNKFICRWTTHFCISAS